MSKLGNGKGNLVRCICGGGLVNAIIEKNGIKLHGQKCTKCGEMYFSGSEMLRYDVLTGRSNLIRKVRKVGDSLVVTVPKQITEKYGIHEDDSIYFESEKEALKIKIIHLHEK